MKRTILAALLIPVTILAFSGCSSDSSEKTAATEQPAKPAKPPKDKRPINERITVGMTKDEVQAACGKPKSMITSSDAGDIWVYSDSEKAFIPYYALSGGTFHQVTVTFDKDGKVAKVDTSTTSRY